MPAGPDSSGIQETFQYSFGLRISFFAVPYSHIFKPSRGSIQSSWPPRAKLQAIQRNGSRWHKYFNFPFILPQNTKLVTSFDELSLCGAFLSALLRGNDRNSFDHSTTAWPFRFVWRTFPWIIIIDTFTWISVRDYHVLIECEQLCCLQLSF